MSTFAKPASLRSSRCRTVLGIFALLFAPIVALRGVTQTFAPLAVNGATGTGCASPLGATVAMTANGNTNGTGSGYTLSDKVYLCAASMSGNFMMTARVSLVGNGTMAGLELRDDSTSTSRNESIYLQMTGSTPSIIANRRSYSGPPNLGYNRPITVLADTDSGYLGITSKFWFRIIRFNDQISILYSPDQSNAPQEWRASTSNQSLPGIGSAAMHIGLLISGASATATFDKITLTSAPTTQPITSWLGATMPGGGSFTIYRGEALAVDTNNHLYVQGQGEQQSATAVNTSDGSFYAYYEHSHYNAGPAVTYACGNVFSAELQWVDPVANPIVVNGKLGVQYYDPKGGFYDANSPTGTSQADKNDEDSFDATTNFSGLASAGDDSHCTVYALEGIDTKTNPNPTTPPPSGYTAPVANKVHVFPSSPNLIQMNPPTWVKSPDSAQAYITLQPATGTVVHIALDPTRTYLWGIVQGATSAHIEKFSIPAGGTGSAASVLQVYGFKDLRGIAVDSGGNVYVTDHDPSVQAIKVLDSSGHALHTLGLVGGAYAENPRGTNAATSLSYPEGVAVDAQNNVYVASSGPDAYYRNFGNSGMVLRKYTPNSGQTTVTSLTAANLAWEVDSLEYIDGASPDAFSPADVYTKFHHYKMTYANLGKTDSNGRVNQGTAAIWKYQASTVDDVTYPSDPRVTDGPDRDAGANVRTINSKKFLIVPDQNSQVINIFRFPSAGSEGMIPYARFNRNAATSGALEIWVDGSHGTNNGTLNGVVEDSNPLCAAKSSSHDTEETCVYPSPFDHPSNEYINWFMDLQGDVWTMAYSKSSGYVATITEFIVQGSTEPSWCWTPATTCVKVWNVPATEFPLSDTVFPLRILYDTASQSMFLAGYTGSLPKDLTTGNAIGGGLLGTQMVRYDHWLSYPQTGSQPKANCTWTIQTPPAPPDGAPKGNGPRAWDYAQGLLVTGNDFTNRLTYYYGFDASCATGTVTAPVFKGTDTSTAYGWIPGGPVGSVSGTIDSAQTLNLYYNGGNQYLTFVEEGGQHKIHVFSYTTSGIVPTTP